MTNATNSGPESTTTVPEGASAPLVRPEELPPVEPPSAGFIVQLFLIPALIVAAVIGVWALFGKLAESETDWQQLVSELGSSNEHRRWRAALGLAQVLRNQQIAPDENGVPLAEQPQVIKALTSLLSESLASTTTSLEDLNHQDFLARTLGALKSDELVLPVLAEAMTPERQQQIMTQLPEDEQEESGKLRKSCLMSIAMIAGRHFEEQASSVGQLEPDRIYQQGEAVVTLKQPLPEPVIANEAILQQLKLAAQDPEDSIRHLAAFVLALVSGPDSIQQLQALLQDRDEMTRANAAVGLARNGLTDGIESLSTMLEKATTEVSREEFNRLTQEEQETQLKKRQFEQPIILSNSLRAIDSVLTIIDKPQRDRIQPLVEAIAADYVSADVRLQAQELLQRMQDENLLNKHRMR